MRSRTQTSHAVPSSSCQRIARCRDVHRIARAPRASATESSWGPFDPPLPRPARFKPLWSHHEATRALDARDAGESTVEISLDFHLTPRVRGAIEDAGVRATTSDGEATFATWSALESVAKDERGVYEPEDEGNWLEGGLRKVQTFSEDTGRAVSLMPSGETTPATALIGGFSMHRFGVGVDPEEDTRKKLGAIAPIRRDARLLDVCTGLAYTSCMAFSEYGCRVSTIELDRSMTEMCHVNPHSRALFEGQIEQLYGNGADVVKTFEDNTFDYIVTDPPTFSLAGELYSAEFYADLKRILRPKGKVYHYIGDPKSSSGGKVAAGVVRRLKEVGFDAAIDYDAHGVVAAVGRVRLNRSKTKPPRASKPRRDGTVGRERRDGRPRARRFDDDVDDR